MKERSAPDPVARYADQFAALAAEPRLRILRLLLSAHPRGMVVGQVQDELGIPGSTLSHHLEKLRVEGLVTVRRERQFLWYAAHSAALQEILGFLYAECCSRASAVPAKGIAPARARAGRPRINRKRISRRPRE